MSENEIGGIVAILVGLGALVVGLVIMVMFILNLSKTLEACSAENQAISPGLVWLLLVPIFNWFWIFYVVIKVKESLKAEFTARGLHTESENYGFFVGMIWACGSLLGIIPVIGILGSLAALVCYILYWVQTNQYKNRLLAA